MMVAVFDGPRTADAAGEPPARPVTASPALDFAAVYSQNFDFVFRSVRRLGVPDGQLDDAVQDVFIVVHRRLADFEGRSSLRTWLFGILLRVARKHRASAVRHGDHDPLPEHAPDASSPGPMESASRREAAKLLRAFLDGLDDDKREAFVLAELEQMTVPEVAEAVGANASTVYSRLRAARQEFEQAVARHRAREDWR